MIDFAWKIVEGVVYVALVIVILSGIVAVGLSPQPGNWLYSVWSSVRSIGFRALLLSIIGVGGVGLYLLERYDSL